MKLIGLKIHDDTTPALLKSLPPGWYPLAATGSIPEQLLPGEFNGNPMPEDFFRRFGAKLPEVNISVIVGRNGSGKSTFIELLMKVINNFTFWLRAKAENPHDIMLSFVCGIYADLYYELDGVMYRFKCTDRDLKLELYDKAKGSYTSLEEPATEAQAIELLTRCFFYTIAVNYSLYSFNSDDSRSPEQKCNNLHRTSWVDNYFHRVDGYLVPMTIVPPRLNGSIDITTVTAKAEKNLCAMSLLFLARQQKGLIDGYTPDKILFKHRSFSKKLMEIRVNRILKWSQNFDGVEDDDLQATKEINGRLTLQVAKQWRHRLAGDAKIPTSLYSAYNYLTYKTLKICANYPHYREFLFRALSAEERMQPEIADLIAALIDDPSHITLKLHATVAYIRGNYFTGKLEGYASVEELMCNLPENPDYPDVVRQLPPPFFYYEMRYRKTGEENGGTPIALTSMSSGERQLLFMLTSVLDHLANLSSISPQNHGRSPYHNVNLIFDEAELYFHPEYQRQFVKMLLEILGCGAVNPEVIKSLNILLVTHSPYILSDIPGGNILHIEDPTRKTHPMAANIYDLLKEGFFMKEGIGEVSSRRIREIVRIHDEQSDAARYKYQNLRENFKFFVEEMGEGYMQHTLRRMLDEMDLRWGYAKQLDIKIRELEREVERLKSKRR